MYLCINSPNQLVIKILPIHNRSRKTHAPGILQSSKLFI
nr:MAG TPA: hypothetical protein [Caudoviricetes sp.]